MKGDLCYELEKIYRRITGKERFGGIGTDASYYYDFVIYLIQENFEYYDLERNQIKWEHKAKFYDVVCDTTILFEEALEDYLLSNDIEDEKMLKIEMIIKNLYSSNPEILNNTFKELKTLLFE